MRPVDAGSFAERLYDELEPLAVNDEAFDWALLVYLGGLGRMFQEIEDLARDTDAGPGWSALLDLDRIPDKGLVWLAQFVGVQLPVGLTPAQQRQRIASTDGWQRGTVAAIKGAVQVHLTGEKEVTLFERDTSAYHFSIHTRESQTPIGNVPLIEAAILEQKPAGLQFDYLRIPDWTLDDLDAAYPTLDDIDAAFATLDDIDANDPI